MDADELKARITRTAMLLNVLEPNGDLQPLDSLQMIDFVVALEEELGMQIPTPMLRFEVFKSIDAMRTLLQGLLPA
jgi:acyl carrier protein